MNGSTVMGVMVAGLVAGSLFAAPALAKTVEVQTIPVTPAADSSAPAIPAGDIDTPDGSGPTAPRNAASPAGDDLPQVLYNTDMLPKQVKRMHDQLKEAALSGNMERLRMVLESNEMPPTVSFGATDDPIDFLKESSGDGEGFETLAILADILDAGFLHVDQGTAQEMYVWPYFARYPLDSLTPEQKVELFRIVTAGDFAGMQEFGGWTFYRVGIGPDGTLHYFVAGD
ncbi:hypothetical protein [Roseibium sp. M-1]